MALFSKLSRNVDIRLAQLLKRLGKKARIPVSYETGAGTAVPTSSQPSGGAMALGDLSDVDTSAQAASYALTYDGSGWIASVLGIAGGGTGEVTVQAAINALSAVAGATNEHVLTKDTATGNAIFKAATGAPTDAEYVVMSLNGTLTAERVLTAGDGISLTDGGAGSTATIANTAFKVSGTSIIPSIANNDLVLGAGSTLGISEGAAGTACLFFTVTGDGNIRLSVEAGGTLNWGDGTNAPDVELYRSAANTLSLGSGDSFIIPVNLTVNNIIDLRTDGGGTVFRIWDESGDTTPTFSANNNGILWWSSGAAAVDVTLQRIDAGRMQLDDTLDLEAKLQLKQAASPGNGDTGYNNLYADSGNNDRIHSADDNSNVHDLCVAHKQSMPGKELGQGAHTISWESAGTAASSAPAVIGSVGKYDFDFTNIKQDAGHGRWTWQALREIMSPESLYLQSVFATGFEVPYWGDTVTVSMRFKVTAFDQVPNPVTALSAMYLYLTDTDGTNYSSQTVSESATWSIVTHTFDISGWSTGANDGLRAGAYFMGANLNDGDIIDVDVYIEWIAVEQWVK